MRIIALGTANRQVGPETAGLCGDDIRMMSFTFDGKKQNHTYVDGFPSSWSTGSIFDLV